MTQKEKDDNQHDTYPTRCRNQCLIIVRLGDNLAAGHLFLLFRVSIQHAIEGHLHTLEPLRPHVRPIVPIHGMVHHLSLPCGHNGVGVVLLLQMVLLLLLMLLYLLLLVALVLL